MPRYIIGATATLDVTHNVIHYFDPLCHETVGVYGGMSDGTFPYRNTVMVDGDELVLSYQPHAPGQPTGIPHLLIERADEFIDGLVSEAVGRCQ
jgi:hypothetical protein